LVEDDGPDFFESRETRGGEKLSTENALRVGQLCNFCLEQGGGKGQSPVAAVDAKDDTDQGKGHRGEEGEQVGLCHTRQRNKGEVESY